SLSLVFRYTTLFRSLALVVASNLLSDVATHLLTVHRQSDRGIGQPQLVLVVHLQARRDAAAVLQLVLEGRSPGNILNGTHDSLAALTDALREVVGVVLTTNARPARPRQRTPLSRRAGQWPRRRSGEGAGSRLHVGDRLGSLRSEEHTSELQSRENLVCRLLLEKKKKTTINLIYYSS